MLKDKTGRRGAVMGYRDEVTVIRKAHRVISHKTAGACALLLSKVFAEHPLTVSAPFDRPPRCTF